MAQLNNLIVTGSSRFLNKVYFSNGGTFNGNININNGELQIYGRTALMGYDSWLRINESKHFTSGIYCGNGTLRTDGEFQVGDNGNCFKANSSAITCNRSLIVNAGVDFGYGATIRNAGLELYFSTPFIDFHFNNSNKDFTSRIIESRIGNCSIENGTLNITNASSNYAVFEGNGKTNGYFHIATIKIIGNYIDRAMVIGAQSRGYGYSEINLQFINANNTDPGLNFFNQTGRGDWYIKKTATSTWNIYCKKSEVWGYTRILKYIDSPSVTLTWGSGNADLPASSTRATQLAGSSAWCYNNDSTYINGGNIYTGTVTANEAEIQILPGSQTVTFNGDIGATQGTIYAGSIDATGSLSVRKTARMDILTFYDYQQDTLPTASDMIYRRPIASAASNNGRVAFLQGASGNKISIRAQYGKSDFSSATFTASSSDIRLKEDVKDSSVNALSKIMQMQIREFNWKQTGVHQELGCVADELELIDPLLTTGGGYDDDGTMNIKSIDTLLLSEYAIKGIQELYKQNKHQQKRIEYLESQLKNK